MASLPSPVRERKPERKPLSPVSVVGRFIGGATAHDLLIGAAVLEVEDSRELTSYWCQVVTDRGHVTGYALKKFNSADVYHLPASLDSCDCPDGTFKSERPGGCRHQQALRQALTAAGFGDFGNLAVSPKTPAPRVIDRKTERDELTGPGPDWPE